MNQSVTFNNSHQVIKKDSSDEYHTNKINPLPKNTTKLKFLSKIPQGFYLILVTDFVLDLPEVQKCSKYYCC